MIRADTWEEGREEGSSYLLRRETDVGSTRLEARGLGGLSNGAPIKFQILVPICIESNQSEDPQNQVFAREMGWECATTICKDPNQNPDISSDLHKK